MNQRLDEIRARCELATPGPWKKEQRGGGPNCHICHEGVGWPIAGMWTGLREKEYNEDADFIAHARDDIPYLLAEVERLAAENELLTAERDAAVADINAICACVRASGDANLLHEAICSFCKFFNDEDDSVCADCAWDDFVWRGSRASTRGMEREESSNG